MSQRYSLAATVNYSTFLSIPEACTIDKKNILHTPIQQDCCCSYLASRPSDRYKNIVDYYYQDHVPGAICYPKIIPEEGHTGLVFRCNRQKPGAFLVGTPTSPRDVDYITPGCEYFIVFFCFGMHHVFYPVYATELTDRNFSLDEITSGKPGNIIEKIILASTFQERILIFEEFIEERMPMFSGITPEFQYIVSSIRNNAGIMNCEGLINCNLYTDRHIRRLFDKYIGISPKFFSNLNRYYKVTRALAIKPNLKMSVLATEFGYYDQAHFINEFRRFLGFTPNQFTNYLTNKVKPDFLE
ncbi:MAG: helix-turn-helix domain-containing protein [Spirochaetes bacterium]|nr:helix-turn-helix domain-containing protein [Spirochaetota bacterium]